VAGFRFAPRALLELGKELISSDEVAIYELIKNGIDAGSPRVEIEARIVVPHSAFIAALDALDEKKAPTTIMELLGSRVIPGASVEAIAEFLDAIRKYSGDKQKFRAALVEAYRDFNWIEVSDSGEGMALSKINDVYLTVGTRSRRAANVAGASYLGDKGVGRLSAMRLGDRLTVTTSTRGENRWNILDIDWTRFSHDIETPLDKIGVDAVAGPRKSDKSAHGTTIRTFDLSADWTADIIVVHGPHGALDRVGRPRANIDDGDDVRGRSFIQVGTEERERGEMVRQALHKADHFFAPNIDVVLGVAEHAFLDYEKRPPLLQLGQR